jgi:hypothetical protein
MAAARLPLPGEAPELEEFSSISEVLRERLLVELKLQGESAQRLVGELIQPLNDQSSDRA